MTASSQLSRRPRQLITELLEEPDLVAEIQALHPEALLRVIRHIGLEDAAELVDFATSSQLEALFDEEWWQSEAPGEDERFDDERFALWLAILLESGERSVAEKLAAFPEDLLLLGLQRRLLVLDLDELAFELADAGDDADLTEKALDGALCHEFDQYRVVARRHDGWDSVLGVLLALDTHDRRTLERLLERLSALSNDYIADNGGLYDVLTSEEMLEVDVAGEREDRRAAAGFVAPSTARSFLRLAETTPLSELTTSGERDPVTRAYFRALSPLRESRRRARPRSKRLRTLLRVADPTPLPSRRLPGRRDLLFVQAMQTLAAVAPELYATRLEELAYVTNVLIGAGARRRPLDAAELAVDVVETGLRHLLEADASSVSHTAALLEREPLDKLFRIGWHSRRDDFVSDATSR